MWITALPLAWMLISYAWGSILDAELEGVNDQYNNHVPARRNNNAATLRSQLPTWAQWRLNPSHVPLRPAFFVEQRQNWSNQVLRTYSYDNLSDTEHSEPINSAGEVGMAEAEQRSNSNTNDRFTINTSPIQMRPLLQSLRSCPHTVRLLLNLYHFSNRTDLVNQVLDIHTAYQDIYQSRLKEIFDLSDPNVRISYSELYMQHFMRFFLESAILERRSILGAELAGAFDDAIIFYGRSFDMLLTSVYSYNGRPRQDYNMMHACIEGYPHLTFFALAMFYLEIWPDATGAMANRPNHLGPPDIESQQYRLANLLLALEMDPAEYVPLQQLVLALPGLSMQLDMKILAAVVLGHRSWQLESVHRRHRNVYSIPLENMGIDDYVSWIYRADFVDLEALSYHIYARQLLHHMDQEARSARTNRVNPFNGVRDIDREIYLCSRNHSQTTRFNNWFSQFMATRRPIQLCHIRDSLYCYLHGEIMPNANQQTYAGEAMKFAWAYNVWRMQLRPRGSQAQFASGGLEISGLFTHQLVQQLLSSLMYTNYDWFQKFYLFEHAINMYWLYLESSFGFGQMESSANRLFQRLGSIRDPLDNWRICCSWMKRIAVVMAHRYNFDPFLAFWAVNDAMKLIIIPLRREAAEEGQWNASLAGVMSVLTQRHPTEVELSRPESLLAARNILQMIDHLEIDFQSFFYLRYCAWLSTSGPHQVPIAARLQAMGFVVDRVTIRMIEGMREVHQIHNRDMIGMTAIMYYLLRRPRLQRLADLVTNEMNNGQQQPV